MSIQPGDSFSHFRILSKIGSGGMGDVYLAEDTKLERKVAIKFLSAKFSSDKEKLNRFIQEAKATSALNHPNILTVYEIDEFEGSEYIATEYIEGETLRERLKKKNDPLSLNRILKIGTQVAEALSAAHQAGIAHRDIKPENIMIRRDGYVKVLDFGLAKLTEKSKSNNVSLEDETRALVETTPGMVMGTVTYMSPEQARGQATDERTDLWSLGVVLYEMLSGKVPFEGETVNHTIVAILESDPRPVEGIPEELQRIVRKLLTKSRENRFQSARDLFIDLKNLRDDLKVRGDLERSVMPDTVREAVTAADANDQESAGGTVEITQVRPERETLNVTTESSLEYAVKQAKGHKLLFSLIAIFVLAAVSAITYFAFFYSNAGHIESIAVMPFANSTGDKDVEYLSDGMTESLITSLSRIPGLSVKARSTVFYYKGKPFTAKKLGSLLNVQAVLFGTIAQRGDAVDLNLELVDARTENVLWSESYDRKMDALASFQNEIAQQVSDELRLEFSTKGPAGSEVGGTANSEAYREYLKGRFYWNKRTPSDIRKSLELFRKAVELDPGYAKAWSGLADAHILMPEYGHIAPSESVAKAREAANKALGIDPDLAAPHATLGYAFTHYDWKFSEAEGEYRRAIEIDPNYGTAHQWYAELLSGLGRHDEARKEIDTALKIDPLSYIFNLDKTWMLYRGGKPEESIEQAKKWAELYPTDKLPYLYMAGPYRSTGDEEQAFKSLLRFEEIRGKPANLLDELKSAYRQGGFKEYFRVLLEATGKDYRPSTETVAGDFSPGYSQTMAEWYVKAGVPEKAIEALERGYNNRDWSMPYIGTNPVFAELHSDPRFIALLKKIGLPVVDIPKASTFKP